MFVMFQIPTFGDNIDKQNVYSLAANSIGQLDEAFLNINISDERDFIACY